MKPQEFFYTAKPIFKQVSAEEFVNYVNTYPRKLRVDAFAACTPPFVSYNDFELANRWPHSIVASYSKYSSKEGDYLYGTEEDCNYSIMINYEEVFASKTGNQVEDGE